VFSEDREKKKMILLACSRGCQQFKERQRLDSRATVRSSKNVQYNPVAYKTVCPICY